jgi:hypothetical protein
MVGPQNYDCRRFGNDFAPSEHGTQVLKFCGQTTSVGLGHPASVETVGVGDELVEEPEVDANGAPCSNFTKLGSFHGVHRKSATENEEGIGTLFLEDRAVSGVECAEALGSGKPSCRAAVSQRLVKPKRKPNHAKRDQLASEFEESAG